MCSPPKVVAHDTPPLAAKVDCVNVRVWPPLPQVNEQLSHPLHDPAQLTGQASVEQACDCSLMCSPPYVAVHDTPPLAAAVDCVNVLVWLPLPQVNEQLPHPLHDPAQLTGQASVEQAWDCSFLCSPPYVVAHGTPPLAAAVDCVNVRDWLPLPQVDEQITH